MDRNQRKVKSHNIINTIKLPDVTIIMIIAAVILPSLYLYHGALAMNSTTNQKHTISSSPYSSSPIIINSTTTNSTQSNNNGTNPTSDLTSANALSNPAR